MSSPSEVRTWKDTWELIFRMESMVLNLSPSKQECTATGEGPCFAFFCLPVCLMSLVCSCYSPLGVYCSGCWICLFVSFWGTSQAFPHVFLLFTFTCSLAGTVKTLVLNITIVCVVFTVRLPVFCSFFAIFPCCVVASFVKSLCLCSFFLVPGLHC